MLIQVNKMTTETEFECKEINSDQFDYKPDLNKMRIKFVYEAAAGDIAENIDLNFVLQAFTV